ncbi:MAG: VCBS repeat-containing protein [Opitutaceae bacterium]
MRSPKLVIQSAVLLPGLFGFLLFSTSGCRKAPPTPEVTVSARVKAAERLDYLTREAVGQPIGEPPWIAHVNAVDLDQDGRMDILACEARENTVVWLRQTETGGFVESVVGTDMSAPVHVEASDLDKDGDLDLIVSSMGFVFPNNDRIGTLFVLENDGSEQFTPHKLLENVARVTDARAADFNGDGQLDLVVGQFGYDQGEIRWMERIGPWEFVSHGLLDLSGTINVCPADFNADGRPDIVALVSQQWEEIYYFENLGGGQFGRKVIFGSTNQDYGSSGISLSDLDRDGDMDVVYSNGDGFGPAALPGPRPWHGVQWLENEGRGQFRYHRIGYLPGAYSPVGTDLDGDGDVDVVATSAYSDWNKKDPKVVSLMWFRNDGRMAFEPQILAYAPKDLISAVAADFDGSGRPSLVTGGFPVYAPFERMGRITLWHPSEP